MPLVKDSYHLSFHLHVEADPSYLPQLRDQIRRHAALSGFGSEDQDSVLLAAGEALSNALEHGSPGGPRDCIGLSVTAEPSGVTIEVLDQGPGFSCDPARIPAPDPLALRGRGIPLMVALMDDVEICRRAGGGTRVTLRKRCCG